MKKLQFTIPLVCVSLLLSGCSDDDQTPSNPGDGDATQLTGVYWELDHEGVKVAAASDTDLPNVYYFSESRLKYYNDDKVSGTYEIEFSDFDYDEETKSITFNYYDTDVKEVQGIYSFDDGKLIIDGGNDGFYNGFDQSDNKLVEDAAKDADDRYGESKVARIQNITEELSGTLNMALSEPAAEGSFDADITYRLNEDSAEDGDSKAYVAVYTNGFTSANSYGELLFEAIDGERAQIKYRKLSNAFSDPICEFTMGETLPIKTTWGNDQFSFTIENAEVISDSADIEGNTCTATVDYAVSNEPVKFLNVRIAAKKTVSSHEVLVDNVKSVTGETVLFDNDFESFEDGYELGGGHGFRGESAQATVITVAGQQ
ncbi:hypothetical protein [Vibrio celticus]|uniref:Lipoprotein n=1 Tax=Vibrio celticus TaxID=446372 RepID=A0A1C3JJ89_9VIBR|nr:hypothetical protein [Vibrio celticus]SBT15115.1 hypothetical protein VCE7224_03902 [Vibrio celticus]